MRYVTDATFKVAIGRIAVGLWAWGEWAAVPCLGMRPVRSKARDSHAPEDQSALRHTWEQWFLSRERLGEPLKLNEFCVSGNRARPLF